MVALSQQKLERERQRVEFIGRACAACTPALTHHMYLGIDIGTSGVKVVLLNEQGLIVEQATSPLEVDRPRPLWSEQDPDAWWSATDAAVRVLDRDLRRRVRAIGLAGQMHGATLLGTDDRPLRPAILWNDGRSFAECAVLEQAEPTARAITGNLAMPGFTAPKLLWVQAHEPEVFARVRRVLLPKDYVRLHMTGDAACDMADASGTLWLDVGRRCWSSPMLAACGLNVEQMPVLFEGTQPTGLLRQEIADGWAMARVPVAASSVFVVTTMLLATLPPAPLGSAWWRRATRCYRSAPPA